MNTKEYIQISAKRLSTPSLDYITRDWLETLGPVNKEDQKLFDVRRRITLEVFIDEKLRRAEEEY